MHTEAVPGVGGEEGVTVMLVVRHDMERSIRLASLVAPAPPPEERPEWDDADDKTGTMLAIDYDHTKRVWGLSGCSQGVLESHTSGEQHHPAASPSSQKGGAEKTKKKGAFHIVAATWREMGSFHLQRDGTEPLIEVSKHERNTVRRKGLRLMIGGSSGKERQNFQGQIAEALVFRGALNPGERERLTCYLSAKFDLNIPVCQDFTKRAKHNKSPKKKKNAAPSCPGGSCKHGKCGQEGVCLCSRGYFGDRCDEPEPTPSHYTGLQVWLSGHRFDNSMASWPGNTAACTARDLTLPLDTTVFEFCIVCSHTLLVHIPP